MAASMTQTEFRYARVLYQGQPSHVAVSQEGSAKILSGAPWLDGAPTGAEIPSSALRAAPLLCPVQPSKIIGIGRNYKKHAEELKNEVPEEPLMFFKPPSSLLAPGGEVVLPQESSRVDYEGELVVVIGERCRRIPAAQASRAIFGYSIACDVTARDLQTKDKQWTRAKGFDTFCPVGPYVTELRDASALRLQLFVNGERRQDGRTSDMIFDIASLIAYASNAMTLEPGDIILTGTPEGVGPLSSGDAVSVQIEGLGELGFGVVSGRDRETA
jgi:2-keto-4-pentenoate hydratase/2-oxohepta-3-ene-1,7-dioic acid hydratase in catechol pathway